MLCDVSQPARGWVGSYIISCSRWRNRTTVAQKAVWRKSLPESSQSCFPNCANSSAADNGMLFRKWRALLWGRLAGSERRSEPMGHTHTFLQGAGGVCPLHNTPSLMQGPGETFVTIECQREVVWDTRANSPATQIQYADTCF